jgi:cold shock CspA family protein
MHVVKYVPTKLYGFVQKETEPEVFFHIRSFSWGCLPTYPPPVIGEEVEVEWDPDLMIEGKAPKAKRVSRLFSFLPSIGVVEDFNPQRGYGFIRTADGRSHYLHRSEMTDGKLPLAGMRVTFFEGFKEGRTRACYVSLVSNGE